MAEDKTPTNVVDEGIELYHSISKGGTVNKNFHAGTYNAALDRASQFYGGEQLYKIANDNLDFIQEQANDLVSELSQEVSFEKVEEFYEVTDGMVTREINITLPTGVEARFNIVAETSFNDLTVKFQDLDGYDGAEIYSETLDYIEYEPDNLIGVTSTIDITGDENVAEGLLDEIGLKSQAGDFNYKDGYDLYKVNIKPDANVVNIPNKAIFVEFGIEKEMSSDFIQGFIERPKVIDSYKNVTQIKIDGKTYDITDTFTSSQALQEHFKNADVLVYTNDIEDVGSKSYMFLNENSYVLEKINDAQFNVDVANKYIKNNPYEKELKLARKKSFIEPERYQVLLEAFSDIPDTPTNVVDDVIKNKGTINEWFNEAIKEYDLVSGTPTGRKDLLRYSDFEEFLINKKGLKKETAEKIIKDIKTGVVTQVELGPTIKTGISPEFAKATGLTDIGISQNVFKDFGVQNYLDTVYTQTSDLSSAMYDRSFADRQALQNTFYDSLKNSDDVIEIYLRQVSSINVPAENVFFKSQLTQEVPGFYTEPIGGLTPGQMASGGGIKPTENFYKLQINKNNLLIDVPGVNFSNELKTKLDWNLLEKELGINYSQFKDIDSYQLFHTKLSSVANDLGIDNTKLYSTLRKSGYEGTVGYVNRQVEVVLLDPNDDIGIGKKVNFENSNVDDFYNNQSKVNQLDELVIKPTNLDELVIKPTNVVDDVVINASEAIDNVNNLVDELPLEEAFRKQVKKNTARIGKNAATPGGIMDLIDSWELGVLVLAVAAISLNEVDEIPTILYNQGVKMYNNMLSSVGLPVQVEEKPYNINFQKAIETLNIAEMFMPTAYAEKALVKEFKKGQEAGIDISAGLGAGAGVPPMQFKTEEPKEDTGNINSIMTNLMSNISNAQKSYPITADEIGTFGRNPINVVPEDTKDKPVKVEYDSKEKQNLHDIYANLYTKLSNASARIE